MDKSKIIKLFLPPKCVFCSTVITEGAVCAECGTKANQLKIEEYARDIKHNCFKHLDKCISFYYYRDTVRDGLLYAKFKSCGSFLDGFIECMGFDFEKFAAENKIDVVISMPAHKSKFYTQEYDLPQEMARRIAKRYNLQYNKDLVTKIKKTKSQHELNYSQRKSNLNGAFRLNTEVKGKNILIIDDIVSTGYSLEEIAKCLKKGGAAAVMAVTFAYNNKM